MTSCRSNRTRGFTLLELAIGLVAISLILGGLARPLARHIELKRTHETHAVLNRAREALLGFAIANNNRLPCPDVDGDGVADPANAPRDLCPDVEGYLPATTLGVEAFDGWGRRLRYRANNAYSQFEGVPNPPDTRGALLVQNRRVERLTLTNPHAAAALLFSCGKNGVPDSDNRGAGVVRGCSSTAVDGLYVQGVPTDGVFDDILIWVSKNVLLNRLVSASRWP
ncbi:MAG: type II secretion system GspH family protein [Gammaproteobacteria bacterium]|nr:type II secretion system GspH family protein [Gammaproteobacteria bacterium]